MKKLIILGLVFLLSIIFVNASDSCNINKNCTWYAYGVTGDSVNITFTNSEGNTTTPAEMIFIETGKYYYTTIFFDEENILGCATQYNESEEMNTVCESKTINNTTYISEEDVIETAYSLDLINGAYGFIIFVIFVIILLLLRKKE